jgi:hypothetical protein
MSKWKWPSLDLGRSTFYLLLLEVRFRSFVITPFHFPLALLSSEKGTERFQDPNEVQHDDEQRVPGRGGKAQDELAPDT